MTTEKSSLGNFMFMPIVEQVQRIVFANVIFQKPAKRLDCLPGAALETTVQ